MRGVQAALLIAVGVLILVMAARGKLGCVDRFWGCLKE
jgi:hypothetical protein